MRLFVIALLMAVTFAGGKSAQAEKFYAVSTRHSAGAAKQNAEIKVLQAENQKRLTENNAQDTSITTNAIGISAVSATTAEIAACGDAGKLYGPSHTQASGNCIDSLTIDAGGHASFAGSVKIGTASICDGTAEGALRYNSSSKEMEYCDGAAWKVLGSGGGGCNYNYLSVSNATLDTYYSSNAPALSGFGGSQTATADGDSTVTIVKNGADTGLKSVTVGDGDTVGLRVKSPNLYSRVLNLTMDIGTGFTSCWQVATKDRDLSPDAFTLTDLTDQELSTVVTSNVVTLSGFDGPVTASVSGQGSPKLRVNAGSWTVSADVHAGDTLQLQMTSSADHKTLQQATVSVGNADADWNVTTKADHHWVELGFRSYSSQTWGDNVPCDASRVGEYGAGDSSGMNPYGVRQADVSGGGPPWSGFVYQCQKH